MQAQAFKTVHEFVFRVGVELWFAFHVSCDNSPISGIEPFTRQQVVSLLEDFRQMAFNNTTSGILGYPYGIIAWTAFLLLHC